MILKRRILGFTVAVSLAGLSLASEAQPQRRGPPQEQQRQQQEMPQQGPAAPLPWIDVHMHLVPGRDRGMADYGTAVEAALDEMNRFGIRMALLMPPPQVDAQQVYDAAAFVPHLRRHAARFAWLDGGGSLNATLHRHADPATVTDAVRQDFLRRAAAMLDAGAKGFGEIAALHLSAVPGHPFESVPADHPLLLALADLAAARDVPIELHMDAADGATPTPPRFAQAPNPPVLPDMLGSLPRLLAHNPKARIVWAHGGSDQIGGMSAANLGRLMDSHANLYVSLRIHGEQAPTQNKVFAGGGLDPVWVALLTRHADRFMIGSDSFMTMQRGGGPGALFAERNAPKLAATNHFLSLLPPDVLRKVAVENAERVYGLGVR